MFGRKAKPAFGYRLHLYSESGELLREMPLQELPLPEACVLELSERYFNDPEPCVIHRNAVRMRVIAELFDVCPEGQRVCVDSLSETHRRCFADTGASAFLIENCGEK